MTDIEPNINDFYSSTSINDWKILCGEELHYHYGTFRRTSDEYEKALRETIHQFYPYIPKGSKVLDAGCGWGGTMTMLIRENQCKVDGITTSIQQYDYAKSNGLNVKLCNLESLNELDDYDVILMCESLEHINNKFELLKKFRTHSKRIILRMSIPVNGSESFLMPKFSEVELVDMLKNSKWTVSTLFDSRLQSIPTLFHWKKRLKMIDNPSSHLKSLVGVCESALSNIEKWVTNSLLLNVVAN